MLEASEPKLGQAQEGIGSGPTSEPPTADPKPSRVTAVHQGFTNSPEDWKKIASFRLLERSWVRRLAELRTLKSASPHFFCNILVILVVTGGPSTAMAGF